MYCINKMDTITKYSEKYVTDFLANPYVMAIFKIVITLYAAQMAPRLPEQITTIFANTWFKLAALFIIVYIAERDFQLAILLALVFVFGSNYFSGRGVLESFAPYSSEYTADSKFKLIEPKTNIYPGCENLTMANLEAAFEGDKLKLQKTVMYAFKELLAQTESKPAKENLMRIAYATGLPYNVVMNDENAPLIATILMYHGFKLSESCTQPN
jgi:hypothetical protein